MIYGEARVSLTNTPRMTGYGLIAITLLIITPHTWGYSLYGQGSCTGRCDQHGTVSGSQCQCNEHCLKFGDCCVDYMSTCVSCAGRCGDFVDSKMGCQCNSHCLKFGDCCADYEDSCLSGGNAGSGSISDSDLKAAVAELWDLDYSRLPDNQYSVNVNGNKLFTHVNEDLLLRGTWPLFADLLDNYNPYVGKTEPSCPSCREEESMFLNAALNTPLMRSAWQTLYQKGLASNNLNIFKSELAQYWFLPYSRSGGKLDSSGFEHVFVGEIKSKQVSGFHNWLRFYLEEKDSTLTFDRHVNSCTPNTMSLGLTWLGYSKSSSSMFMGTSPEFEMAVYTMCFLARPNQTCTVSYGGKTRKISTYRMSGASKNTVGTAHPYC